MKIVIDGRMLGWTGIGRYTRALLEELQALDHQTSYTVLLRGKDWELWEPSQPNFERVRVDIEPYSLGEQLRLGWTLRRLRPDLVHFLGFNSPIAYKGRRVTTIHDLTLLDFRNYRGSGWRRLKYDTKYHIMRLILRAATQTSQALITPTEHGKQELVRRRYATAGKIYVTPEGASELPPSLRSHNPAGDYLLYVGNMYPYKNLARLIEALPAVRQRHPKLKLVIVGQLDVYGAQLQRLAEEQGVAEAVVLPGFVSDEQLAAYYQHAKLYLFPSLSEGFGLPALEAMGYGLPVAAARASCLPEVLGDAAVYFDPHDSADMARVISEALSNPKRLSSLKTAGRERVKQFSWAKMAQQTLEVYQKALRQ